MLRRLVLCARGDIAPRDGVMQTLSPEMARWSSHMNLFSLLQRRAGDGNSVCGKLSHAKAAAE